MRLLVSILLTFFPSFIENKLRKLLLNQIIGKGSKIGFFAILNAKNVEIGSNSSIKSLSFISGESLEIGDYCTIKSFSFLSTRVIKIANYVHIANFAFLNGPNIESSKIVIGNHSRIFPFCWLDTNQGITIGNNVGIGGFSLIFTHGVWANYFKGGPVTFKEVVIEDNVWLPWRVFVMPGVTIGKGSIIGANSLVNKNIAENSLAAGSPAKTLKEDFIKQPTSWEVNEKLNEAITDFYNHMVFRNKIASYKKVDAFNYSSELFNIKIDCLVDNNLKQNQLLVILTDDLFKNKSYNGFVWEMKTDTLFYSSNNYFVNEFSDFIRRYGVRLTKIKIE